MVPRSLLAGSWIAVLVCYLDDSGKDPQNPITTIAGYIAKDTAWQAFEVEVEKWFTEFKVNVLHANQLHDTDGDFAHLPGSRASLDDGLEHVGAHVHLRATSGRKASLTGFCATFGYATTQIRKVSHSFLNAGTKTILRQRRNLPPFGSYTISSIFCAR
jgi:hypothetical protein